MQRIQIWQWPNILALDAALIAVVWQAVFAKLFGMQCTLSSQIVLGLSVWLTYMADRLFDVAQREPDQLQSYRHRYAKQYAHRLWLVWGMLLIANSAIAVFGLTSEQMLNGFVLLAFCLAYTALNQRFSGKFFPKELCVALIFAAGVIIFLLPNTFLWQPSMAFALLCLINCLIIGKKEHHVDAALRTRSLAGISATYIIPLEIACAVLVSLQDEAFKLPAILTLTALIMLHATQKRLLVEHFRVLADSSLILGPAIYYWLSA